MTMEMGSATRRIIRSRMYSISYYLLSVSTGFTIHYSALSVPLAGLYMLLMSIWYKATLMQLAGQIIRRLAMQVPKGGR